MRLYQILYLSFFLLFLIASCEKEENRPSVKAGITNNNMLYFEYNPALELNLQTDSLGEIKFGIDSIDIDLDGRFDIFINQRVYLEWTNDFNRTLLKETNFPYVGLSLKNNFEVAFRNIPVNVGKGYFNNIPMVDTISYESRIDGLRNWHDSKMDSTGYMGYYNGSIWPWGVAPSFFWSCGIWYSLKNKVIYLGIKKINDMGDKLGWIKVKVYSRDKFEIISYAIEK